MGLFDNIAKGLGFASKQKGFESGNLGSFLGMGSTSGRDMQYNRGWVYAAVHAISEAIANIDFVLYERKSDGSEVEVTEHPILDLLDGVNPTMTGYELKHRTGSHLELTGNAYWLLMGKDGKPVKTATEAPAAIYPLIPAKVGIERGQFPVAIKYYRYSDIAENIIYQPFQILHLRYPNPNDDALGLAPVEALKSWIETDLNASDFQRVFFINGARIGGILKASKSLSREQIELLRIQWHEMSQGVRNAHKPIIMPDYLTYEDNTKNNQEMDFVNSLNELRDKILAGLRVPKTLLGNAEGNTNRATAETATYVFALYTIKPKMKMITAYLNEFLVPRFGENLYLGFRDPVPENKEVELSELEKAMGGQSIMTINEARSRYLGLPSAEGGDSVLGPLTTIPVATTREPVKSAGRSTHGRKDVTPGKPFRTQSARNAQNRQTMAKSIAATALESVMKTLNEKKKSIEQLSDDEYEKIWMEKIARTTPYEKKIADELKKVNAKMSAEVIKNLENVVKMKKAIDPTKLVKDADKYVRLMVESILPIQISLFTQEGEEAVSLIGVEDVEVLTPEAKKAVEASVEKMAGSYNDTTLALLKQKLEQGVADSLSISELTDVVNSIFEFSDTVRAEAVARTETTRISNDAKVSAWKDTGIVKSKTWYTAADERVCPICDAMNGTTIDLEENFFDTGDTIEGTDGTSLAVDYGDMNGPPSHPNCRCDLRPSDIQNS